MLRNEVCKCRASGVFLRLSAQGLIAENNIHSNGEAGLDIRKGANPTIVVNATQLLIGFQLFKDASKQKISCDSMSQSLSAACPDIMDEEIFVHYFSNLLNLRA